MHPRPYWPTIDLAASSSENPAWRMYSNFHSPAAAIPSRDGWDPGTARPEQGRANHAEHCGIGADPKREGENGCKRETGVLTRDRMPKRASWKSLDMRDLLGNKMLEAIPLMPNKYIKK